MELRKANLNEVQKLAQVVGRKHLDYITTHYLVRDYNHSQLYVVVENNKILAIVSLVPEPEYGYTAVKRLCILNKKNQGKGIARFAIHEILRYLHNCKVGATPWEDNTAVRHILEAEGFKMEYKFMGHWCFYSKEM